MRILRELSLKGRETQRAAEAQVVKGKQLAKEVLPNIEKWQKTALPGAQWQPFTNAIAATLLQNNDQAAVEIYDRAMTALKKWPTLSLVQWHHYWQAVEKAAVSVIRENKTRDIRDQQAA
ncbi:MAG: hypothetical protein WA021_05635 [Minisyncoccia bacterium]